MILDSSAVIAVVFREEEHDRLEETMSEGEVTGNRRADSL